MTGHTLEWFLGRPEEVLEQVQEDVLSIFRRILRGDQPSLAYERQMGEPIHLSREDRRWLEEHAEAFRLEFQKRTGTDLRTLTDSSLELLLKDFLEAARGRRGRLGGSSGSPANAVLH